MNKKVFLTVLLISLFIIACTTQETSDKTQIQEIQKPTQQTEQEIPTKEQISDIRILRIMTHDSFAASEEVIQAFEEQYNAKIKILLSGDTGTALNKAILSKGNPIADVFYGIDNTYLSRALDEDIFEQYNSPMLSEIPDQFKLDSQNRVLPVDFGDVCLNYDILFFNEIGIAPPETLEDLLDPDYKGLLVTENPAISSPGLAFLLTTINQFGEEGYLDYWTALMENDALIVNDWESAYYSEFSRSGGTRPIVVSYASSPPFEVIYADQPMEVPPTAAVTTPESCFRQIEFVGILNGTKNRDLAEKWIDFMLSTIFQEDVPMQMFVFPVNQNAKLDETFIKFLTIPDQPASIDPTDIANNREKWIQEWTETILR